MPDGFKLAKVVKFEAMRACYYHMFGRTDCHLLQKVLF